MKCLLFILFSLFWLSRCQVKRQLYELSDCKQDSVRKSFYDAVNLECKYCSQNYPLQKATADKLNCECGKSFYDINDRSELQCSPCGEGQIKNFDDSACVSCLYNYENITVCGSCDSISCSKDSILIDRYLNGSLMFCEKTINNTRYNMRVQQCVSCAFGTLPNAERTQCRSCSHKNFNNPEKNGCNCPESNKIGEYCFTEDDIKELRRGYNVGDNAYYDILKIGETTNELVFSSYFAQRLDIAYALCKLKRQTSYCQELGNLCVLSFRYSIGRDRHACSLYNNLRHSHSNLPLPWIYYDNNGRNTILQDLGIPTTYTFKRDLPTSKLQMKVAIYHFNGTFLGIKTVENDVLQLCPQSDEFLNSATTFGASYTLQCKLSSQAVWSSLNHHANKMYEMFLEYEENKRKMLFALPLLIGNLPDSYGTETAKWLLLRRFFLLDQLSLASSRSSSNFIRIAHNFTLLIQLQPEAKKGQIYPPLVKIHYVAYSEDPTLKDGHKIPVKFSVDYEMDLKAYHETLQTVFLILCIALPLIFSFVQTYAWFRRSGHMVPDFQTLIMFILFVISSLSNLFFMILFGASIWWLVFYRNQDVVFLFLPSKEQEDRFFKLLIVGFVFKCIYVAYVIWHQSFVDIFLIDWEKGKGTKAVVENNQTLYVPCPPSIWRTYFVANEWNELQTTRRINKFFQLFAVLFVLKVMHYEQFTKKDPSLTATSPGNEIVHIAPESQTLRFAVSSSIYIVIGIIQWIFFTFIYERFIVPNKMSQFVDFCALTNVGVFILSERQFGYLIYGRYAYGSADIGLGEMLENFENPIAPSSGIDPERPEQDQRTFMITIPLKLREYLDQNLTVLDRNEEAKVKNRMEKYDNLNNTLIMFLNHALRDCDYVVKDKRFLEAVLGYESEDFSNTGIFYRDDGFCFSSLLFCGNELSLQIFETSLFAIIDLAFENFILSACFVYVIGEMLVMLRDTLGQKNLATKTRVSEKFLI